MLTWCQSTQQPGPHTQRAQQPRSGHSGAQQHLRARHSRCSRRDPGPTHSARPQLTHSRCSQKLKAWPEVSHSSPTPSVHDKTGGVPKERDRGLTRCRKPPQNKGPGGRRGGGAPRAGERGLQGLRVTAQAPDPWTAEVRPSLESGWALGQEGWGRAGREGTHYPSCLGQVGIVGREAPMWLVDTVGLLLLSPMASMGLAAARMTCCEGWAGIVRPPLPWGTWGCSTDATLADLGSPFPRVHTGVSSTRRGLCMSLCLPLACWVTQANHSTAEPGASQPVVRLL